MDRRYAIATLFFIAAILIVIVMVYPQYKKQVSLTKTVAASEEELQKQNALIQEVKRVEGRYEKAQKTFEQAYDLLPILSPKSIPDLFIELEGITSTSGLSLESIGFVEGKGSVSGKNKDDARTYKKINTQLTTRGSYADLKKFMQAIEVNRHLMDITTLSIAGGSGKTSDAKKENKTEEGESTVVSLASEDVLFTYTISLDAYYQ